MANTIKLIIAVQIDPPNDQAAPVDAFKYNSAESLSTFDFTSLDIWLTVSQKLLIINLKICGMFC